MVLLVRRKAGGHTEAPCPVEREGSVYQYGNAGKWRAEINIYKDGVRYHKIRSGFKTKRDAVQALPEMRELVLNGQEFAQDATCRSCGR